MLKELAACLKNGGRLVVEVPSSEDALLTLYKNDAFQHFSYWSQHLFLFKGGNLATTGRAGGVTGGIDPAISTLSTFESSLLVELRSTRWA